MWLLYGSLTVICYGIMDFFIKRSAGKIDDALGSSIINIFSFLVPFIWYLAIKFSGKEILFTKQGAFSSAIAGIAIGFGTVFFLKMFATGVNLSTGVPLVRMGIIILAFLVGILVLKENVSITQIVGLVLSLAGLYLIIAK